MHACTHALRCYRWNTQPNGVSKSTSGRHLYVASTLSLKLAVLEIVGEGQLKTIASFKTPSLCDNIDVDSEGNDRSSHR